MRYDDPYEQIREINRQFERAKELYSRPLDEINEYFRRQQEIYRLPLTRLEEFVNEATRAARPLEDSMRLTIAAAKGALASTEAFEAMPGLEAVQAWKDNLDYAERLDRHFWGLTKLQQHLPQLEEFGDLVADLKGQLEYLGAVRDQITFPSDYLGEVGRLCEALGAQQLPEFKALALPESMAIQETLRRQQQELDTLATRLSYKPSHYALKSLVSTEALLETQRITKEFIAEAMQPQIAYQEFARQQLELAATAAEEVARSRLLLVDIGADLLEQMTRGFELGALMYSTPPEFNWISRPAVNVYRELTIELEEVELEEEEADIEGAVLESHPAQVVKLGWKLIQLIYDLNTWAKREGKPEVFKPTNRTLLSCATIPSLVASDEQDFAVIIDHLYFLLYEGSGEATRLKERCTSERLEALWRLRHLRRDARHDVDHGKDKDMVKKHREAGDAFRSLIGIVAPRGRADWIQAQVALYAQLAEMLTGILLGYEPDSDASQI